MNQTKKLTQGAMMLAIIGALILIDRMTAYWFTELLVLIMPVVIIMYSAMHTFNDGVMLSVGVIIIAFLLGNFQFTYLIYVPVGILTALTYSLGIKRGYDKQTLLMIAILTYVFGEIVATFVVYPILGFPIARMIEEYKVALGSAGSFIGYDYAEMFALAGIDFGSVIVVLYVVSTILVGVMEGFLIHLFSIAMLKRFKIADLGSTNIWDIKPNKTVAYVCMILTFAMYFARLTDNQTIYYACITASILSSMVLMYYGYLFVILYGVIVLRRNVGSLFMILVFFVPILLVVLMLLGFLYGAGPLREYLERKKQVKL